MLFGDFLALASEQLETAAMDGAKLPAAGAPRAGWELSRITAATARSADAFVLHDPIDESRPLYARASLTGRHGSRAPGGGSMCAAGGSAMTPPSRWPRIAEAAAWGAGYY